MDLKSSPSQSPLLPPSPSHHSGSSQCTSPEALVSCIRPGLVICFTLDSILVSMLFSQNIPPTPSPTESKVCYVHLCIFYCFAYRVIVTIFLNPYICISILYWCLSFWFTSLCIMGSSFIHLIRADSNEFFLVAE